VAPELFEFDRDPNTRDFSMKLDSGSPDQRF